MREVLERVKGIRETGKAEKRQNRVASKGGCNGFAN